jgi:ribosome-associated translation inhibitor RaiA
MRHDPSEPLHVEFDTRHCQLNGANLDRMRSDLDTLVKAVENFPDPKLHVLIEHNARTNDYSVKTSLLLQQQALVASDHHEVAHAAYEQCLNNLMRELSEYKDRLGRVSERQKTEKGTRQDLLPTVAPDLDAVGRAVAAADYVAFRAALLGYEEPLRDRIGRWVERQPSADGQLGRRFTIADLVEEVYLDAFEAWERRPGTIPLGEWLAGLIDPALKEVLRDPDATLENVRMVRSLQGVPTTREER